MGTTVSSLQILGVPEQTVRDALPRALVGQWSARFVTACLYDMFFQQLDRKAGTLSKKLGCTVLSVSMFDGDVLTLSVYQNGKFLTRHSVDPESERCKAGNPTLFCTALGLPEALAPKLKRLFAGCELQEEKLSILQALLGAPLFLRYGDGEEGLLPEGPIEAGSGPLEKWIEEHPALPKPPKIKNRCRAELIQEIPDLCYSGFLSSRLFLFRPLLRAGSWMPEYMGHKDGEILGPGSSGGERARPLPDGRLELTALEDPLVTDDVIHDLFDGKNAGFQQFIYAYHNDRLVTAAPFFVETDPGTHPGTHFPYQTVVLRDSAGKLPCPFPLKSEGKPVYTEELHLMFDGGLLAFAQPRQELGAYGMLEQRWGFIIRYGPDGAFRYQVSSETKIREEDLAALRMEKEDRWRVDPCHSVTDGQGRLWLYSKNHVECLTPEGELISRHRLPGNVTALCRNEGGQACAITFAWKKYLTRVYRFT